jgi:murein DD-endopeptidase MepM/ murein hydrolase activator NlpD
MRCLAMASLVIAASTGVRAAPESLHLDVRARAIQPGELVVLAVTTSAHVDRVRVRAFDRDVPAFQTGDREWQALIGIDLDSSRGAHVVSVDAGGAHATTDLRVAARRFPTRTLTVDATFVNPPAGMQDRIAREARELAALWTSSAPERLWTAFVRPVPQEANSAFGTRSVFNGQPRAPHAGADFISPEGTPIHAPAAGRIVLARALYFTGNTIVIDHGLGLFSLLAHLSRIDVQEGASVSGGAMVGLVGATGRVTGPHLHWAVRVGGSRVDPISVLAALGQEH